MSTADTLGCVLPLLFRISRNENYYLIKCGIIYNTLNSCWQFNNITFRRLLLVMSRPIGRNWKTAKIINDTENKSKKMISIYNGVKQRTFGIPRIINPVDNKPRSRISTFFPFKILLLLCLCDCGNGFSIKYHQIQNPPVRKHMQRKSWTGRERKVADFITVLCCFLDYSVAAEDDDELTIWHKYSTRDHLHICSRLSPPHPATHTVRCKWIGIVIEFITFRMKRGFNLKLLLPFFVSPPLKWIYIYRSTCTEWLNDFNGSDSLFELRRKGVEWQILLETVINGGHISPETM